jgi:hypothetical protein
LLSLKHVTWFWTWHTKEIVIMTLQSTSTLKQNAVFADHYRQPNAPLPNQHIKRKLLELLCAVRENYVFGDSFPSINSLDQTTLEQVKVIHDKLVQRFSGMMFKAMPESREKAEEYIWQIASKSTAFCSAIALGEIDDLDQLAATANCIALVYWVDHGMDRGDQLMCEALNTLLRGDPASSIQDTVVKARYEGITQISVLLETFAYDKNDLELLTRFVYEHTLFREMHVVALSEHYLTALDREEFWANNAQQIAYLGITNGALIFVASMIYQLYRHRDPALPDLAQILDNQEVLGAVHMTANAVIRGWDDLGDRHIDAGEEGDEWGKFTLNLFNQNHPLLLGHFLSMAGVPEARIADSIDVLNSGNEYMISEFFVELVRDRFAAISPETAEHYAVFLTIIKRVVEAGYVNRLNDIRIAEAAG